MPQSINLNSTPYFDDFEESKNYKKVLFKPGVSLQARELTSLQSALQSQIEVCSNAIFLYFFKAFLDLLAKFNNLLLKE